MARIEIQGSPEELERIVIFLRDNNIPHRIMPDFGNHSKEEMQKYEALMAKYKPEDSLNGLEHI